MRDFFSSRDREIASLLAGYFAQESRKHAKEKGRRKSVGFSAQARAHEKARRWPRAIIMKSAYQINSTSGHHRKRFGIKETEHLSSRLRRGDEDEVKQAVQTIFKVKVLSVARDVSRERTARGKFAGYRPTGKRRMYGCGRREEPE